MFPIRDENPSRTTPIVTWIIIAVNIFIFIYTYIIDGVNFEKYIFSFGTIPEKILRGESIYTLLTSMYMHGGLMHIFGNMLYLNIFGDNVEDAYGHLKYLAFYTVCGVSASLIHTFLTSNPQIPAVGASGAISGILGAYVILYPRARILTAVFFRIIYFTRVPASLFIGFWFIMQLLLSSYEILGYATGIAVWAHIGGFIVGLILSIPLKARIRERSLYYFNTP
jgi:membrane associated rhomboid family serine protease